MGGEGDRSCRFICGLAAGTSAAWAEPAKTGRRGRAPRRVRADGPGGGRPHRREMSANPRMHERGQRRPLWKAHLGPLSRSLAGGRRSRSEAADQCRPTCAGRAGWRWLTRVCCAVVDAGGVRERMAVGWIMSLRLGTPRNLSKELNGCRRGPRLWACWGPGMRRRARSRRRGASRTSRRSGSGSRARAPCPS
jgi:hypothetical protein